MAVLTVSREINRVTGTFECVFELLAQARFIFND
jgi:hypothetical protein